MSNVPGRKKETAIVLRMRSRTPCNVCSSFFLSRLAETSLSRHLLSSLFILDDDSHERRVTTIILFSFYDILLRSALITRRM